MSGSGRRLGSPGQLFRAEWTYLKTGRRNSLKGFRQLQVRPAGFLVLEGRLNLVPRFGLGVRSNSRFFL
jgi:hypothetical protein